MSALAWHVTSILGPEPDFSPHALEPVSLPKSCTNKPYLVCWQRKRQQREGFSVPSPLPCGPVLGMWPPLGRAVVPPSPPKSSTLHLTPLKQPTRSQSHLSIMSCPGCCSIQCHTPHRHEMIHKHFLSKTPLLQNSLAILHLDI